MSRNTKICSMDGCGQPSTRRGWCEMHYVRWYRHGDPNVILKPKIARDPTCTIEGCGKLHTARGLCSGHYKRFQRHGDPRAVYVLASDARLRQPA